GGNGRYEMIANRVAILHDLAIRPAHHQTARGCLLVSHSDTAVKQRPACAVARIELVVVCAREIAEAVTVEPPGVVPSKPLQAVALRARDVGIERVGLGCE